MSANIAAQLYTVREFLKTPEDIAESIKKVGRIGYRSVQLSALGKIDPAELKKILDGEGISVCATHIGWGQIVNEPQAVIDEHNLLGCKHVAIGSMPQDYRVSADGYCRFAKEANVAAAKLAEGGLTFSYHNHNFEFAKFDGKTAFEIIYSESDPKLLMAEPDTYWIQAGGGDPALWINWLKGRCPLIHLKDMVYRDGKPTFAEIGEGNLNWPAIFEACDEAGAEWYIVEQDTCEGDPFDSLRISLENLKKMQADGLPGIRA